MLDFSRFQVLTFDCYGTLIDWETGLLGALRPVLRAHGRELRDEQILALYAELEPLAQNPYRRYREVLQEVVRGFGKRLDFQPSEAEVSALPESLKTWSPFPDTVDALRALKGRYRLAIISNTDDDLFAATARHLKVAFDEVVTAEQAQGYKPSPAPFRLALQRLELPRERVLHVGQSVYHDVVPAKSLGLATVLVRRRGFGATRAMAEQADLEIPDLRSLAALALP
ncbi:MAG TPA: haloacid dehalogenase type II [Terriglobales bacterium]|nr:haloacid dehalogenase type II [Terriglobales bacterium]